LGSERGLTLLLLEAENRYHIIGPVREVYLKEARNGSQDDPGTVTEIQIPVEKD